MNKKSKILAFIVAAGCALSLVACSFNNPGESPSGGSSIEPGTSVNPPSSSFTPAPSIDYSTVTVKLNVNSLTIVEDEYSTLFATVNVSKTPEWSSDNASVASVSASGKVIAKKPGTATITASVGPVSDSCTVTVTAAEVSDDRIEADEVLYLSLEEGNTPSVNPTYFVKTENGEQADNAKKFTYRSSNESIATVDENGVVTPVGVGATDIVVTCGSVRVFVKADVYTSIVFDADDWLKMIAKKDISARYYLANDIDFTGVTYSTVNYAGQFGGFTGELNGGYHTLSNITVTGSGTQSLFGGMSCCKVRNIAFTGVKFTTSNAGGICTSLIQHKNKTEEGVSISGGSVYLNGKLVEDAYEYSDMNIVIFPAVFENIILDAQFVGHGNAAFCQDFYGGQLSNLYFNLTRGDQDAFKDADFAVCKTTYIWSGVNAVNNVVICLDGGELNMQPTKTSNDLPMNNVSCYTSAVEANYAASRLFDKNIFEIPATGVPSFAATQSGN